MDRLLILKDKIEELYQNKGKGEFKGKGKPQYWVANPSRASLKPSRGKYCKYYYYY